MLLLTAHALKIILVFLHILQNISQLFVLGKEVKILTSLDYADKMVENFPTNNGVCVCACVRERVTERDRQGLRNCRAFCKCVTKNISGKHLVWVEILDSVHGRSTTDLYIQLKCL